MVGKNTALDQQLERVWSGRPPSEPLDAPNELAGPPKNILAVECHDGSLRIMDAFLNGLQVLARVGSGNSGASFPEILITSPTGDLAN